MCCHARRTLAPVMAASAAYTAAAAAAEADYLSLLKEDRTTGFPVFSVQADEGEHAVQIMESTDYILGDGSHHFEDLEHLRQFCTRCAIWDWTSSDLMAGKVPPSEKIAAIVRNMPLMQQMVRTCPPMALKMLLLFLGAVMQRPLEADLLEASQMHMKFNAVKGWLLSQVLPDEKPEDILAGWNLDASEAAVFEGYKRLWTAIYNQESAENQKEGDSEVESQNLVAQALEENRLGRQRPPPAEYFYRFCPSARNAEHISALQAWEEHAGGSLPSSPGRQRFAASVEAPVPVGMKLIGNSLSVYWQARGIAAMAGSAFASSSGQAAPGCTLREFGGLWRQLHRLPSSGNAGRRCLGKRLGGAASLVRGLSHRAGLALASHLPGCLDSTPSAPGAAGRHAPGAAKKWRRRGCT
eukprot:TRINITY_DN25336_c0_g1_i2.p1 TRINITY_DN25336_c0_g1~~TRINITY_DN25336_c0_g1_i2.p1  ORF type:complete len:411 (-),score=81.48 TRINITY_DN25336_c0_g1_i2:73-1305(-)